MDQKLREIADGYLEAKKRVLDFEGKTAISSLTPRTFNDIRNCLDDLMNAIAVSEKDPKNAERLFNEAIIHLQHYAPNAYEVIAGKFLRNTRERLDSAGLFSKTGRAKNLFNEAIAQYTRGRQIRSQDPDASLPHFEKSADLAQEAGRMIEPATVGEKVVVWGTIILVVLTILNLWLRAS